MSEQSKTQPALQPCLIFILETNKQKHGKISFSLPLKHDPKSGLYSSPLATAVCPINIFIHDKMLFEKRAAIKSEIAVDLNDAVPTNRQLMKITPRTLKQIRLSVLCQDVKTASTYRFYEHVNSASQLPLPDDTLIFPKDIKVYLLNRYVTGKGKRVASVAKIELGRAFIDIAQVELAKMVRDMNERSCLSLAKRKRENLGEDTDISPRGSTQQTKQVANPRLFKAVDATESSNAPPKKRYRSDNYNPSGSHSDSASPSPPSSPSKATTSSFKRD